MIILYQIAILAGIILASFGGLGCWFAAIIWIVGFSLSNIFTMSLLVIQGTTIVIAAAIGFFIALIVSISNAEIDTSNMEFTFKSLLKPLTIVCFPLPFICGYIMSYLNPIINEWGEKIFNHAPEFIVGVISLAVIGLNIFAFALSIGSIFYAFEYYDETGLDEINTTVGMILGVVMIILFILGYRFRNA